MRKRGLFDLVVDIDISFNVNSVAVDTPDAGEQFCIARWKNAAECLAT